MLFQPQDLSSNNKFIILIVELLEEKQQYVDL